MQRRRLLALGTTAGAVAMATLGTPLAAASAAPAADAPGAGLQRVVVTGQPGQAEQVARDVQALGGVLRSRLAIVDGGGRGAACRSGSPAAACPRGALRDPRPGWAADGPRPGARLRRHP